MACSDFTVKLSGTKEDIETASAVVAILLSDDNFAGQSVIQVEGSYRYAMPEDVVRVAKCVAQSVPEVEFEIRGTTDDGDYMDFLFVYQEKQLYQHLSDWYKRVFAEEYDTYESFVMDYDEYTEEEYNLYHQKPYYILDDESIVPDVPLNRVKKIPLKIEEFKTSFASSLFLDDNGECRPDAPAIKCKCGTEFVPEFTGMHIAEVYAEDETRFQCPKCGKEFTVFCDI